MDATGQDAQPDEVGHLLADLQPQEDVGGKDVLQAEEEAAEAAPNVQRSHRRRDPLGCTIRSRLQRRPEDRVQPLPVKGGRERRTGRGREDERARGREGDWVGPCARRPTDPADARQASREYRVLRGCRLRGTPRASVRSRRRGWRERTAGTCPCRPAGSRGRAAGRSASRAASARPASAFGHPRASRPPSASASGPRGRTGAVGVTDGPKRRGR